MSFSHFILKMVYSLFGNEPTASCWVLTPTPSIVRCTWLNITIWECPWIYNAIIVHFFGSLHFFRWPFSPQFLSPLPRPKTIIILVTIFRLLFFILYSRFHPKHMTKLLPSPGTTCLPQHYFPSKVKSEKLSQQPQCWFVITFCLHYNQISAYSNFVVVYQKLSGRTFLHVHLLYISGYDPNKPPFS